MTICSGSRFRAGHGTGLEGGMGTAGGSDTVCSAPEGMHLEQTRLEEPALRAGAGSAARRGPGPADVRCTHCWNRRCLHGDVLGGHEDGDLNNKSQGQDHDDDHEHCGA